MLKSIKYLLLAAITFFMAATANAQEKLSISGKIFDEGTKEPLYYAVILLEGTSYYDLSDENGYFEIEGIVPGEYTAFVKLLGYQELKQNLVLKESQSELKFHIPKSSLALKDVVVTAQATQSNQGSTTYKIEQEAIQQVQAISISDILQLIPGNQIGQTNLNSRSQINLRNTGDNSDVNSFGTSVIVDGNQLSNDNNMQGGLNSAANNGVDLREISASDIESVEVVAGVPSAKYGNITSGAVIIKKKAGRTPFNFSYNSTPTAYQLGGSKGIKMPDASFLNVSLDYTYSNSTVTSRQNYYQRINTGVRWTKEISKKLSWNNNMSASFGSYFDGKREDPDEQVIVSRMSSDNKSYILTNNGSMKILGRLNYSFNINYRTQHTLNKIAEDGPIPVIESLEEGTFIVDYSPISFYQQTEFFGKPLNINSRIEAEQTFNFLKMKHNTNFGCEYAFNKNYGEGRVIKEGAASPLAGERSMNFYNLPATEIISGYFQDNISINSEKMHHNIKLGLRYDNMMRRYNLFSPRISASGKYFDMFRVRAAYGLSYKAPSMLQLYPGPVYFDLINLNHYANDEIRSFAVVTTHIHQPTNEDLKPSRGETLEVGIDFEHKGFMVRLTGFRKNITDGIRSYSQLKTFEKVIYNVVEETTDVRPEVYATDESIYVSTTFRVYGNIIQSTTDGLELSMQFPKIKATNTKISLSGNYLKTLSQTNVPKVRSSASLTQAAKNRYGVYENPAYYYHNCRSNMTIVQHIPEIKLLVTLITEANWISKKDLAEMPSPYPVAYYNNIGEYVAIPESERASEDYNDLYYSPSYYSEFPTPTYFNFHMQVRKETRRGHSFSFYANNFLWYHPSYINPVAKNRVFKNSPVTFGFGMNFKF